MVWRIFFALERPIEEILPDLVPSINMPCLSRKPADWIKFNIANRMQIQTYTGKQDILSKRIVHK
jgi:hypothetical protein